MKGFKALHRLTALFLIVSIILNMGIGAFAAEADSTAPATETKSTQPIAVNGKDYLFMDFKPGSWERDLAWSGYCGGYDDSRITWTDSEDGELQFTFNHHDSSLRMPMDSDNRLNYVFKAGDIIEVRLRFDAATDFTTNGMDIANNGTDEMISQFFVIGSGSTVNADGTPALTHARSFSTRANTGNAKLKTGVQTLTYTANTTFTGETLYNLRFDVLNGSTTDTFTKNVVVTIDYIYIGPAEKTPVDVVYYGEDGTTVLHKETIPYGYPSTWNNHGKKSSSENGLISLWGWSTHQEVNGIFTDIAEFRVDPSAYPLTVSTRYYLTENRVEEAVSDMRLSLGDDPNSIDDFKITIDASTSALPNEQTYATPLDVAIVLDRSGSMSSVADYNNPNEYFTISDETILSGKKVPKQLTVAISKLDKTKPDGYYRALAWLVSAGGASYGNFEFHGTAMSHTDHTYCGRSAGGDHVSTVYSAPVRYHNGQWQMQILQNCTCNGNYQRPFGIFEIIHGREMEQCDHNTWVSLEDGYLDYIGKRNADTNITGMTQANKAKCHFLIFASRLGKAIETVEDITNELYASTPMLPEGESHRISLVSYGKTVYEQGYPYKSQLTNKYQLNTKVGGLSVKSMELNAANYDELMTALQQTYVYGATRTDAAMQLLAGDVSDFESSYGLTKPCIAATDYLPNAKDGRKRVVILVTDGIPTANDGFQDTVANPAINAAYTLKQKGCEIYTVGLMSDLNDARGYDPAFNLTDTEKTNNFLNLVSSNYPEASSMSKKGNVDNFTAGEKYFFADDGSGSQFIEYFRSHLTCESENAPPAIKQPLYIYNEITREFMVDENAKVKVFAVPYSKDGYLEDRKIQLDSGYTISNTKDFQVFNGSGYELIWNRGDNTTNTSITLKWVDAPLAFLRDEAQDGLEKSEVANRYNNSSINFDYGYRIIVEIPITVNRDNTIGGNNIPVSTPASGLYCTNSQGTEIGECLIPYAELNVNVMPVFEMDTHDYFMEYDQLLDAIEAGGLWDNATVASVFSRMFSYDPSVFTNRKNEYVELEVIVDFFGDTIYSELAYAGGSAFIPQTLEDTGYYASKYCTFDFTQSAVVNQTHLVRMLSNETDSVGVPPYATIYTNKTSSYYAPNIYKLEVVESNSVNGYIGETSRDIIEGEAQIIRLPIAQDCSYLVINSISIDGYPLTQDIEYVKGWDENGKYIEILGEYVTGNITIDLTVYSYHTIKLNGATLTEEGNALFAALYAIISDDTLTFIAPYGYCLNIEYEEDIFMREGHSFCGAYNSANDEPYDFTEPLPNDEICLAWTTDRYNVTWNINGNEYTEAFEYGTMPECTWSTDREPDGCTYYTFAGWDREITEVTEDITYTALYEEYIQHCETTVAGTAPACTETGLTEGTQCDTCGEVLVAQEEIPALGHSYSYTDNGNKTHTVGCENCDYRETADCTFENGACVCGAKEVIEPIYDGNLKFSHSLTLENDISINFIGQGSALNAYDTFYLECKVPVYEGNTFVGYEIVNIDPVFNGTNYEFTLTGVTAKMMNDDIEAVFRLTKDGQEYYSKTDVYSVTEYAYGKLNSIKPADSDALKAICANLLRYGAMAQTQFNYRTTALADAEMTDAHKAFLTDLDTIEMNSYMNQLNDHDAPAVPWKSATLELGNKVIMCLIANLSNYTGNPAELTMRLTYTDAKGKTVSVERPLEPYNEESKLYSVSYDALRATEMRTILSAAIYKNGTRVSKTVEYSIESYGARNSEFGLQELCRAMLAYGDCASAFFAN